MKLNDDQLLRLSRSAGLMSAVAYELMRVNEQKLVSERSDEWKELYEIKSALSKFVRKHGGEQHASINQSGTVGKAEGSSS